MIFLLILRTFLFRLSYTLWHTPQDIPNWKTLLRYTCGKIHQYSTCGCEIKKFQFLFELIQHPWNGPFLGFFGPYSPKYCLILLKLLPEVVSNKKNSVWKILQNLELLLKWNAVKSLQFRSILGPNLPLENQKYC